MKSVVVLAVLAPLVLAFAQTFILRRWYLSWGATAAETVDALPGDDLVEHPRVRSTRAVTIGVPPHQVWPWLVQMGKHRGGFYSYDWLENLVGLDIHSVDHVVGDLQTLAVGDHIEMHPGRPLRVNVLEPNRALVIGRSWAFVLRDIDGRSTRLIVRAAGEYDPDFGRIGNAIIWRVLHEPAYFIMERKTMLRIKALAEASVHPVPANSYTGGAPERGAPGSLNR